MHVKYQYQATEQQPEVDVFWYQGSHQPELVANGSIPAWDSGVLFVGDKGMLLSDYGRHILLPEDKFQDFKRPDPFIPKSLGHHEEWLHACRTGDPTTCNFEYAGWLTEANHLGNVAYRAGQKLEWDAAKMKVTNTSAADRFIRRDYRSGWTLR